LNAHPESDSNIALSGRVVVRIIDRWIVAIGDSYASGEGNPDVPIVASKSTTAKWISG
uniref:Peptidase S1 domain-containing protein n=1 Tax=Anisakis simplex TaxID=6269 RepID=A0A0M3JI72_ANISI